MPLCINGLAGRSRLNRLTNRLESAANGVMKRLGLLRHFKAGDAPPGGEDFDRKLTARGQRDGATLAEFVQTHGIGADLVLCSASRRTRESLAAILTALAPKRVEIDEALYLASAEQILARLRALPDEIAAVMVIGHNPGIGALARQLAGAGAIGERFPKGALAALALDRPRWRDLKPRACALLHFECPKRSD